MLSGLTQFVLNFGTKSQSLPPNYNAMPNPRKIDWSKVDQPELVLQRFPSRRSQVYGTKGVVASSQPLATEAGLEILRKGGNAGELCILFLGILSLNKTH